ncbi:MAG: erythromycin biosynthesis sensory transduction protein eryC1 [Betaproteobacteria bacterium RIFCSPLOWO2_12_FULL_65_14]|nr:MAG: erythromycin biosynthesis sensory transduction protein eryC1 [Betaproteobacteria bacterium RIFCSPLOWO2_12_FULL_65_14]
MKTSIPMVDPAAEYRALKPEIDEAVGRVLASGRYVLGPEGEAFEREVAAYVGAPHAVGCNSGTDALHLALVAAGIGAGDEVVLPAFTFFATAEAISYTGATPVFADIDPATFNISVDSLKRRLSPKTRAVIVVHLFGQCAALDEIAALCRQKSLVLVEDCAQSLGAEYQGRRAGAWGDFGCFSFYPTKNLAAAGDAGLITTASADYDKVLRMLRHHGSRQSYLHERVGWNSRLDELQAAVLRVKLRRLDEFNAARRRAAQRYRERLKGAQLELPAEDARGKHVYHQFTIRSERRDAIREALAADGIAASIFYPMPLHRQPAYEAFHRDLALSACEAAARTVLSLPINPLLDDASIERICARIQDALR